MTAATTQGRQALIYRLAAPAAALMLFALMAILDGYGHRDTYRAILLAWGIVPFPSPFVDLSGSLAAWDCARKGIDIIVSDPCDILKRGYNYSPFWQSIAAIPLGRIDTPVVGLLLDIGFLGSLAFLPLPADRREAVLVTAATLSTMVVFAVERANPDILIFLLFVAAGYLSLRAARVSRFIGYALVLLAAAIKYYPIVALAALLRERIGDFGRFGAILGIATLLFVIHYYGPMRVGIPLIAKGPYDTDLFAAQNLPYLTADYVRIAAGSSPLAPALREAVAITLYAIMVILCFRTAAGFVRRRDFRMAFERCSLLERQFLVLGSTVLVGCFFAGQSIGYRGVFLLFVLPGLLGLARGTEDASLRAMIRLTCIVIVAVMWGQGVRAICSSVLSTLGAPPIVPVVVDRLLWIAREMGWWWMIGVMVAVIAAFARTSITAWTVPLGLGHPTAPGPRAFTGNHLP